MSKRVILSIISALLLITTAHAANVTLTPASIYETTNALLALDGRRATEREKPRPGLGSRLGKGRSQQEGGRTVRRKHGGISGEGMSTRREREGDGTQQVRNDDGNNGEEDEHHEHFPFGWELYSLGRGLATLKGA